MMKRSIWAGLLGVACASVAMSQDKDDKHAPFPLPEAAPRKDWEWDEDERFDELMEQLAINEASLDAVEAAIAKKIRRKIGQQGEARRQDANARMMDRKGGGPMKWDEFYGTNAEKFFYHPVDPNTTYRTDTLLRQMGKAEDDKTGEDTPSRQSLPVHQRPPQWDYIYRANKTARDNALADASIAESEIERLEQRRTELEKEQAVLWCKLAFRAVQRLNVARKPLLRFELVSAAANAGESDQVKALSAAARFLAASLAVVEKAEQDQSVAFGGVATVVTQARESFEDSLLQASDLEPDWESTTTDLGKFYKLSQMLADKAKTLAESYAGAMDGDMNKEAARKDRFRGMLQESVVEYAQILLALNELTDKIKTDWKVRVDTKRKAELPQLAWEATGAAAVAKGKVPATTPKKVETKPKVFAGRMSLSDQQAVEDLFAIEGKWSLENGGILLTTGATLRTVHRFDGDFVFEMDAVVDQSGPEGYKISIDACGEVFDIKEKGKYKVRLQRKGDKVGFTAGTALPVVRVLKEGEAAVSAVIHVRCDVQRSFAGKSDVFIQAVHIRGKARALDDLE